MAEVKAILQGQNKDTATIKAIAQDTATLLSDSETLLENAAAIYAQGYNILNKMEDHEMKRYGFRINKGESGVSLRCRRYDTNDY